MQEELLLVTLICGDNDCKKPYKALAADDFVALTFCFGVGCVQLVCPIVGCVSIAENG